MHMQTNDPCNLLARRISSTCKRLPCVGHDGRDQACLGQFRCEFARGREMFKSDSVLGHVIKYSESEIVVILGNAAYTLINTLFSRLEARFLAKGSLTDLNQAIELWEKLIELVSEEQSDGDWPYWLGNLSSALLRRYERDPDGNSKDLDRSIDLSEMALGFVVKYDPRRVDALSAAAHSLARRGSDHDNIDDVDKAIGLLSQAHGIAPTVVTGFNLGFRLFQASQMKPSANSKKRPDTLIADPVRVATSYLNSSVLEDHLLVPHLHNLIGLCYFYSLPKSPSE